MSTRALFPLLFTVASFFASVGNWAVKGGWCQIMTEDGQALVMLKNGTIGITGLIQGCLSGVRAFLNSCISINDNLIPTSQMRNQQMGSRAIEVEIGQASEMAKKAVHSIAERDVSVLQAFGVRMEFTRGDMPKVCLKFVTSLTGFSPKRMTTINKDPVLQAARRVYTREYDEETAEIADSGSYEVKGNKVEFKMFNLEDHTYDKVIVMVGANDNATGTSVRSIGKQPVCQAATLFYCPRALSHADRWLSSQQLAAMCLLRITRERISGWLSTMPEGNYTGGAGILDLMPENSQIRISPVREFSDNKCFHFIHQAAPSPEDAAFSFVPLAHS